MLSLLLLLFSTPSDAPVIIPPKAADVKGELGLIELGPLFREPYYCSEHPVGQLVFAGDALGTDCVIIGGLADKSGFARSYRSDGSTNADWYGWHKPVLAPVSGIVVGVFSNLDENTPGQMGRPPASMVQIRTEDGVIVTLAHATDLRVTKGETIDKGDVVGIVGNNGVSRSPHIHVGAYQEIDAVPLQIRWDLRAMADVQQLEQ